jgi:pyruvate/2-oxoglutarate dehydrogenase complex dihydrolipoamide acyltransferase (E2) component
MPQMGESVIEGTIAKWLVKEGDIVTEDQPLVEISTDKVDTEIPSPRAGTISKLVAVEGQTLPVGSVIALIDEEGAKAQQAKPGAPSLERARPAPPEAARVAAAAT